jgi:hypothetical protein
MPSLDDLRHAEQTAWLDSGADLVFGTGGWGRLPADLRAAAVDATHPGWIDGGLTARVRRVNRPDGPVALKLARPVPLVRNTDGRLSFVNELLRRHELHELARRGRGIPGVTPTIHASLSEGVIVSPWIDGEAVAEWDERRLRQLFDTGAALVGAGFFEWDFSPGNVLDDGRQVWLFDFGYMYRFDPLRQINTAGDGTDHPEYHLAERIESRNLFGHLLQLEGSPGADTALRLFRLAKQIALDTVERLWRDLAARGASALVLGTHQVLADRWRAALRGDLAALYLAEGWRSHWADLHDDLSGRTCTPMTLRRAQWLIDHARRDFDALCAAGAIGSDESGPGPAALLARLEAMRAQASTWQVRPRTPT